MDSYIIRDYIQGDEEKICRLIRRVYEEFGFPWLPNSDNKDCYDIYSYYLEKGGAFWVVENSGEIVGTCGYVPLSDERCELKRMYLLSEIRGEGLGKKLLAKTASHAFENGFKAMEIWSDKTLHRAHEFYKSQGATPIGERLVKDSLEDESWEEWGFELDIEKYLMSLCED